MSSLSYGPAIPMLTKGQPPATSDKDPHYKLWIPKRCEAPACSSRADLKKCVTCSCVMYCSKACQRADWPRHKQECAYLKSLKLWPHVYRVPANELHCRPAALDACQAAKHKPRTDACNLCGGTENLETTECCGIVLCNHEHNYQVSSYSREFCTRSHRRYSKCGLHHAHIDELRDASCCAEHAAQVPTDWRECPQCLAEMHADEFYLFLAAGPYNTKPPRPAKKGTMWSTTCDECGRRVMSGLEGCAMYRTTDGPRPGGLTMKCNTCCPEVKFI